MMDVRVLMLFLVVATIATGQPGCHPTDEVPCSNGECVMNEDWCDDEFDCFDRSDEDHCYDDPCPESHFRCQNKLCIPRWAVCNGYDNCGDGSDEICEGIYNEMKSSNSSTSAKRHLLANVIMKSTKSPKRVKRNRAANRTVEKAAEYILGMRNYDYGWNGFTSRALVALAFAEKAFPIPENEKLMMEKRLKVQILNFMRNEELSLVDLALYINALYATCQNPRDFYGINLVEVLRSETEKQMNADFNFPSVIMTLCTADATRNRWPYVSKLISMHDDESNGRLGFKALTIMAMAACNIDDNRIRIRKRNFLDTFRAGNNITDTYSKALTYQALNSLGIRVGHDLETHQLANGSFGDLLATYYAIPVLLNTSLVNLKCKSSKYSVPEDILGFSISKDKNSQKNVVTLSLWISSEKDVASHEMLITFEGKKSLYDVMTEAQRRDPVFSFTYGETPYGKVVYSLSGLPNDAESGLSWILYREVGKNAARDENGLREENSPIEMIFPENGNHFIFWRKRKDTRI